MATIALETINEIEGKRSFRFPVRYRKLLNISDLCPAGISHNSKYKP